MKTIQITYRINVPVKEVWQALVNPKYIESWGGGPVVMNAKVGTKFSLWGGDIHGTNIEVVPRKKIVQEWYGGKWDQPSTVTFVLKKEHSVTHIVLVHKNIPDKETKSIEQGWKDYYLGALKDYLEKKRLS